MRINIIGGGLAGTALAYVLKARGADPVIYEASSALAHGASGNDVGLYSPRFSAQKDAVGQYYSDAFFLALEVFEKFGECIDWNPSGTLNLMTDEKKAKRYRKTVASWGWDVQDLCLVNAAEASDIAGVDITYDAMYARRSGSVSPKKLCREYARGVEVHLNTLIENLCALEGDATILACGAGILNFEEAKDLPLMPVRGQVSYVESNDVSEHLRTILSYGSYITPAQDGVHCVGATFERYVCHDDVYSDDDIANLEKLSNHIKSFNGLKNIINNRASVRISSKDYFPVVGQLGEGLYVSVAHGSHGILSSLISANILSNLILNDQKAEQLEVLDALCPSRFLS